MNSPDIFAPNPWLRFGTDDRITLIVDRSEMGQGAMGGLVILAAEELRVPPNRIRTEFAPAAAEYFNPLLGSQMTGGSTSVRGAWEPLRRAAAQARQAFVEAAAARWEVPAKECRSEDGWVIHGKSERRARFGELIGEAGKRPLPRSPKLTPPAHYRWIGRRVAPPAVREKLDGQALFGTDIRRPDMLTAVVARCPVPGGEPRSVNADAAMQVPGVIAVLQIEGGVAVLANGVWAAKEGRKRLEIAWDSGALAGLNSAGIEDALRRGSRDSGLRVRHQGWPENAWAKSRIRVEATYETPYLAHAPLEPMNCTIHLTGEGCEVWVPTQNQTGTVAAVRQLTGLPPKKITVHTPFLGGGFGRRSETDFVSEAVQIALLVDRPVHLVWTLDDDFAHDWFRPANLNLCQAALGPSGDPEAWLQHTVGPELSLGNVDVPYAIPNLRLERTEMDPGLPTGAWRSVGASQNAFAVESFIDELAHAAGADPFEYRRRLLGGSPRHRAVLEKAAEAAEWGESLPEGHGRGIAVYRSYGSWVAQVAEVSAGDEASIRVHRVVCAIDCGTAVDPAGVEAQMEGAVAMGLSAALRERITVTNGRVNETDFRTYPLLRFSEMPEVQVHIMSSDEPPGGVGEPGIPPVAPAVTNAVFAATGRRVRALPLLRGGASNPPGTK